MQRRSTRKKSALAAAATLVTNLTAAGAWAEPAVTVPAGGGLPAMSVNVDTATRSVKTGFGDPIPIPLDASLFPNEVTTKIEVVTLADGKHLAHVTVQAKSEVGTPRNTAWEAVLAGQRPPLFAGLTGFARGEDGERTGALLQFTARDASSVFVVRGDIRQDVRICGQEHGTLLRPEVLDPQSLAWHDATFQRLSEAQRASATHILAVARTTPAPAPLAILLSATGTSAADSTGAAISDGSVTTTWSEGRPTDGHGEFVVMSAPSEVPLASLTITVAPPAPASSGAAPKRFYLVTDARTFVVTMPEDAWAHPGAVYDLPLAEPLRTSCVALVLDEAYAPSDARVDVTVAELTAYSAFDVGGAKLEDVAKGLSDDDPDRGAAAAATLKRGGPRALAALTSVFDTLDPATQKIAIDVALSHASCEGSVPILARAMSRREDDAQLARRAKEKLVRCGPSVGPALASTLEHDVTGRAQAAALLATLAPKLALAPIARVIGDGPADVRASLRAAFAMAARAADRDALRAVLTEPSTADARIDLLRAASESLTGVREDARVTIASLLAGSAPFRTRYLLVEPVAAIARAGDYAMTALLGDWLAHAKEWPLRARAAEASGHLASLEREMLGAARDPEPRVRESALRSIADSRDHPTLAFAGVASETLARDRWTFVRTAAVGALAASAASRDVDAALAGALKDSSAEVRAAAAAALGPRRASTYRDALQARIDDDKEDLDVRMAAAGALGDLCDARSLDRLTELVRGASQPMADEAEARIGAAAIESLGKLHPQDLATRLAAALSPDAPRGPRMLATRVLREPGACR